MKALCLILLAGSFGLVAAGCGGDNKETATVPPVAPTTPATREQTITVRIEGGKPVGGILRARVKKGRRVLLVVRSNVADEVHVHGYDLMQDVAAGGVARIHFLASIPGVFEVELESRGLQIAELTVQ
jgi:hypothetical protein